VTTDHHRLVETVTVILGEFQLELDELNDEVLKLQAQPAAVDELRALLTRIARLEQRITALSDALEVRP
jgi:hypothetical protein